MDNPTFESLIRWEPPAVADEAKGNAAFSAGCFEEAARHFTDAIALPLASGPHRAKIFFPGFWRRSHRMHQGLP
jgi:hypothetical protein